MTGNGEGGALRILILDLDISQIKPSLFLSVHTTLAVAAT